MPKRFTKAEQLALLRALPITRRNAMKTHVRSKQMSGSGISDILKSLKSVLGPIIKEIGPIALKEFIIPMLHKKMSGQGLSLPGRGLSLPGRGLKLAGQGKKKAPKKKRS